MIKINSLWICCRLVTDFVSIHGRYYSGFFKDLYVQITTVSAKRCNKMRQTTGLLRGSVQWWPGENQYIIVWFLYGFFLRYTGGVLGIMKSGELA